MYSFSLSALRLRTTKGLAKMFADSLPAEIYFCVRSSSCAAIRFHALLEMDQTYTMQQTVKTSLLKGVFVALFHNLNIIHYHRFLYRNKIFRFRIKIIKI